MVFGRRRRRHFVFLLYEKRKKNGWFVDSNKSTPLPYLLPYLTVLLYVAFGTVRDRSSGQQE